MGKTIRSPLQNKQVALRINSVQQGKYRPYRKFHFNNAPVCCIGITNKKPGLILGSFNAG